MSQDVVADALNKVMNCKKSGKDVVETKRYSKLLVNILKIAKHKGYLDFSLDEKNKKIKIKILELNECKSIKPRYSVDVSQIEKYMKRFLPSRNFGIIIISTSSGLLTQEEAYKKNLGGSLIAYFY